MESDFRDYLEMLKKLSATLDSLYAVTKEKINAVRNDDVMALNESLKKEQAISLSLRSIEKKRDDLNKKLNIKDAGIKNIPEYFPESMRDEVVKLTEETKRKYDTYNSASETLRDLLECALHQIEKMLESVESNPGNIGIPTSLGTDIRA